MFQENDRKKITKDVIFNFLEDCAEIGVKGISFVSDGESTISPVFAEACKYGHELGLSMAVGTNAFVLTKNRLEDVMPYLTYLRVNFSAGEKKRYAELFEEYFLKSFSSRLAEYTNPEIDVQSKEKLNENYTIVNSILKATNERPEIKIDWRIYTKDKENPLIRDLIIEGLSLARTQKEEFNSVIQNNNGDINSLFKVLEEFIIK